MRTILTGLLLLFASNICAQTLSSQNTELPRRPIKPYATVEEAIASSDVASQYLTPLTEWTVTEKDGNTIFSTSYSYPAAWLNRQLLLRVESASAPYSVSVNGAEVGGTTNCASITEFNVTKKSQQGLNELQIVIAGENATAPILATVGKPSLGKVAILSQPTIRVRDIDNTVRLNDSGDAIAEFNLVVKTDALNPKSARIEYELFAPDATRLTYGYKDLSLEMRGEDTVSFATVVPAKWLWSIHNPTLLNLVVRNKVEGRYAENIAVPIGLREVKYTEKRLYINGKLAPLRVARVDAAIPAEDLVELKIQGYNAVMAAAGVPAEELYARCDSVGVYALPQAAINTTHGAAHIKKNGNPSNNPVWKEYFLARIGEMYHSTQAHPSVVAFSVGESATNGINFYESYLMLKSLESVRPVVFIGAGGEWNHDIIEGGTLPAIKK